MMGRTTIDIIQITMEKSNPTDIVHQIRKM